VDIKVGNNSGHTIIATVRGNRPPRQGPRNAKAPGHDYYVHKWGLTMAYRGFVSSTLEDLKDHRAHVIAVLQKAGISVDPMEAWTAESDEPKQFSQDRVRGCDLCVLLVAFRRGHVPEGETLSITQLEYKAAVELGIDVLVFMLKEEAPWPHKFYELEKDPEIGRWRKTLMEHKGVGFFNNDPNSIEIASALTRWIAKQSQRIQKGEPPYGEIWNCMKSGDVVPFLGAGASLVGRRPGAYWDPNQPEFLPNGRELSNFLATQISFPSHDQRDRDDLGKVSSYFALTNPRERLCKRLHEVLVPKQREYPIGDLHKFLAAVSAPQVIVTTNYDTLLEQAFDAIARPYDLVIHPGDRSDIANSVLWWPYHEPEPRIEAPNSLDIDLGKTTVIYKMHGTVLQKTERWDSFVITEEDYVDFLARMTMQTAIPSIFYEYFHSRSFLFLGYSLRDWNLRVVLRNLSKPLRSRGGASRNYEDEPLPSWAIQQEPSELEQTLWRARGVHIFDVTLDEFIERIQSQRRL
jgi:hypothetical protein